MARKQITTARRRPLKRYAAAPLYIQIRDDIVERISSGDLASGARLPSEPEMTRSYGVGRPTVRQAIDLLRREGYVATVRGSGTFVAHDPSKISLLGFDGLTRSLRASGIEPSDRVVASGVAVPPLAVLSVDNSESGWWTVERVRSLPIADGPDTGADHPFCVETDAFNLDHCPDAAEIFDEVRSASAVLEQGYGQPIARCEIASRAERASDIGVASALGVKPSTPVLVMERVNWSLGNQSVHAVRFVVATERVPVVEQLINPTVVG